LKLASGLSRQITLKYDGSFSEESDPLGYYVLKPYDSWAEYDGDGEKEYGEAVDRYKTGTLFFVYWVGYFTPAYSPRNYLETTKTSVWASSEHANTEIEQYYICSTVTIEDLSVTPMDIGTNGIIAEYRNYVWSVEVSSSIDYNDFNYVQIILDYNTEHEVILVWTRNIDKDYDSWHPSSYEEISGDANFTEQEDYKNIFYFDDDASTVEAYVLNYPNDNTTYVRLNFTGYFMLEHPTRELQDVKVVATAYENKEEKTRVFSNVYWVETKPWWETGAIDGGWTGNNYFSPYVKPSSGASDCNWVAAKLHIPNFQLLRYSFNPYSNETQPASGNWYAYDYYIYIRLYVGREVQKQYRVLIGTMFNCTEEWFWQRYIYPMFDYDHWWTRVCVHEKISGTWQNVIPDAPSLGTGIFVSHSKQAFNTSLTMEMWITKTNDQLGLRFINVKYDDKSAAYVEHLDEYAEQQYVDIRLDLPTNYLNMDTWGVEIEWWLEQRACDGYSEIRLVRDTEIRNQEKEGIDDPPLVLPTEEENWGFWEFLRPAFNWLVSMLYAVLKPLFDAIVGALTTVWTTIFSAITALWSVVVQGLDTLLYWITGQPNLFSSAITTLASWWNDLVTWLTILASNISNIVALIGKSLVIVGAFLDKAIKTLVWFVQKAIGGIIGAITLFWEFFTGTGRFETIGKLSWAILVILAALFPMMYLNHLFSAMRTGGIMGFVEQFKDDLLMLKGLFEGFVWVFEYIWQKFREVYGFIKSHIPTMGGT